MARRGSIRRRSAPRLPPPSPAVPQPEIASDPTGCVRCSAAAAAAAAMAVEFAVREPGREYRRLGEAAARRAVAVVAGRSGWGAEAQAAAASALALYRAALLPGSPRLLELERELDRSTPLASPGVKER